ncbi:MAG: M3 family oligoendopeptidase [Cyclonatronaceae bacterium]
MKKKSGAESVTWNLADLYASVDDPLIAAHRKEVLAEAEHFGERYKGKIAELSPAEYRSLLEEYEAILDKSGRIGSYAYLLWSTNTENAAYGKLMQEANELSSELSQKMVFFDLEWLKFAEDKAREFIECDELSPYRHYLEASRRYKPYMLDEKQEQVLSAKSVTGRQAWIRYFDETLGAARFSLGGEMLTEQEVLSKLHEPDRELRIRASRSLTDGFREMKRTLTFVFNTLLADKNTNDKLRGYPSWISSRNLSNEIEDTTVDILVGAVTGRYETVQRYYRLKRKLLGLDTMKEYDRYAPLLKAETTVKWDQAREMVLNSYSGFHPEMGEVASRFFDKNWIDAAIHPGKRGGAYSASTVPSVHPYVFMNYDGRIRDVQTLAHELGHGVHQYLSRGQGVLQSGTPLTTAETASVFGEMLVFMNLLKTLDDPRERLALLLGKIDDTIATVFRQVAMNRFEHAIHTARRTEGELTTERFSTLWRETQTSLYGDSVDLTSDYDIWWCYIPHFLHTPGYVYAYAFGELLVLALYEVYSQSPNGFADRYMDLLRAGGSDWPSNLIGTFNLDIDSPDFWNKGLDAIDQMVLQAEQLAQQI